MVFSSILFLFFFLPVSLILYYLIPKKYKNIFLLISSLLFYSFGEPIYILLMIFSSVVDYNNGLLISKYKSKKTYFLILSIVINLFLLGFFKYSDFLIEIINMILNTNIDYLNLPLPIGISFFTFQTMSYSIDVYRGHVEAEKNFLSFMLYVCMFPQLIAGPIVRYQTISDELKTREISFKNYQIGLERFLIGLFKKVIIANNIGMLFNEYANITPSMMSSWLIAISFGLQIYFDFSGYSDMAIGIGKMLGFNFLENFNYPYIAKSITEFWRRWHISLSSFFKDYLYIPLGGSRGSKLKSIRNILIVWSITGLWHGASLNFVLWGMYFGVLLVIEKYILAKILEKLPNILKHIYTLFLITISWVIFSFTNISEMIIVIKEMFNINNVFNNDAIYLLANYKIILMIAIVFSIPIKIKLNKYIKIVVYIILLIITTSFLVSDSYNPFLYFRF